MLLPPSIGDLLPKGHIVRVVDDVVDLINYKLLNAADYLTGFAGYHPQMLLKVLYLAIRSTFYSSRKLEMASKESIYFIGAALRFLSLMSFPDLNTINAFGVYV